MIIDSKICEYIRPDSVTDSDAESWEYFLTWQGTDGGVYCWLFEDFTSKLEISATIINSESDNINKVFQKAESSIELIAEDLTENEYDTISGIVFAKKIRRYYKNGNFDNLAIITAKKSKAKTQGRFDFQISVQEKDKAILK